MWTLGSIHALLKSLKLSSPEVEVQCAKNLEPEVLGCAAFALCLHLLIRC